MNGEIYTYLNNPSSEGEKIMKTKLAILFVLLITGVVGTACGTPSAKVTQGKAESILSQEEAATLIDSALHALNTGDYTAWSRDWADDMKAAIKDPDFQEYRNQVVTQMRIASVGLRLRTLKMARSNIHFHSSLMADRSKVSSPKPWNDYSNRFSSNVRREASSGRFLLCIGYVICRNLNPHIRRCENDAENVH
jgi:hypothetical protein